MVGCLRRWRLECLLRFILIRIVIIRQEVRHVLVSIHLRRRSRIQMLEGIVILAWKLKMIDSILTGCFELDGYVPMDHLLSTATHLVKEVTMTCKLRWSHNWLDWLGRLIVCSFVVYISCRLNGLCQCPRSIGLSVYIFIDPSTMLPEWFGSIPIAAIQLFILMPSCAGTSIAESSHIGCWFQYSWWNLTSWIDPQGVLLHFTTVASVLWSGRRPIDVSPLILILSPFCSLRGEIFTAFSLFTVFILVEKRDGSKRLIRSHFLFCHLFELFYAFLFLNFELFT